MFLNNVGDWYEDEMMPRLQKDSREIDSIRTSGTHQTRGTPSPAVGRTLFSGSLCRDAEFPRPNSRLATVLSWICEPHHVRM
jgi:hypothetical protein